MTAAAQNKAMKPKAANIVAAQGTLPSSCTDMRAVNRPRPNTALSLGADEQSCQVSVHQVDNSKGQGAADTLGQTRRLSSTSAVPAHPSGRVSAQDPVIFWVQRERHFVHCRSRVCHSSHPTEMARSRFDRAALDPSALAGQIQGAECVPTKENVAKRTHNRDLNAMRKTACSALCRAAVLNRGRR